MEPRPLPALRWNELLGTGPERKECMSDDTRPYKAGFEAMHERMHGGAAMDTLENAQKRAEYWKAEHLAANAEIERLRTLIRAHVTASNNDDTAGDTFGALMAEVPNA